MRGPARIRFVSPSSSGPSSTRRFGATSAPPPPPTRAERAVKALPQDFDLRRFHVEAEVFYEERRSVREAFGRRGEVRRLRDNLRNGRGLLDGVAVDPSYGCVLLFCN